jgi:NifU-like protein involved in Fe-S cluster formation
MLAQQLEHRQPHIFGFPLDAHSWPGTVVWAIWHLARTGLNFSRNVLLLRATSVWVADDIIVASLQRLLIFDSAMQDALCQNHIEKFHICRLLAGSWGSIRRELIGIKIRGFHDTWPMDTGEPQAINPSWLIDTERIRSKAGLAEGMILGRSCNYSRCSEDDDVTIGLQVADNQIINVVHRSQGCRVCIMAAELLCQRVIGRALDSILKPSLESLIKEEIGACTLNRQRCARVSEMALHNAIKKLRSQSSPCC